MTNKDRQRSLDKKKWTESEVAGCDMAGAMDYCSVCEFSCTCLTSKSGKKCDYGGTSADFVKVPYPCATAYNRFVRKNKEE